MGNYFSSNIKFLRTALGLSKSDLAKKLNVHQSTITRWETGEMGATVDNASDISKALNVPLPELVGIDMASEKYDFNGIQNKHAILFDKNVDAILTDEDKAHIEFIVETRKKQIDKELGED